MFHSKVVLKGFGRGNKRPEHNMVHLFLGILTDPDREAFLKNGRNHTHI